MIHSCSFQYKTVWGMDLIFFFKIVFPKPVLQSPIKDAINSQINVTGTHISLVKGISVALQPKKTNNSSICKNESFLCLYPWRYINKFSILIKKLFKFRKVCNILLLKLVVHVSKWRKLILWINSNQLQCVTINFSHLFVLSCDNHAHSDFD